MVAKDFTKPILLALLIGAANTFAVQWVWAYIAMYTPLPAWLLEQGLRGSPYYSALFVADFVVNLALCAPAAFLLSRLRPLKLWLYLFVAIVPGLLWTYRLVLRESLMLLDYVVYMPGLALSVLPLVVSAFVMHLSAARALRFN